MNPSYSGRIFMDKYKKLASNTVIVGIGSFSSKLLVFLLMPVTTRLLTTAEFGTADLAVQAANLLYPVVSIGIANAILRFGLDSNENKKDVFSTGIFTILAGFIIFLLSAPLLVRIEYISQNMFMIYLYVFFATLHAVCSNFLRANEQIRLYAVDGIFCTALMAAFTVLFLAVFKMGVTGYLLATIVSNAISILFLFVTAKLHKYIHIKELNRKTFIAMLKYSIPLIPSMVFWWITSVSDRFFVTHFIGSAANGLYAAANKVPQIIVILSNIFSDAWLIAAVSEDSISGRDHFFSKVFKSYQAIVFITASGLIMCAQLITRILVSDAFYASWQYMPVLVIATVFSCFVTFLQSVYFVEKKSLLTLITILIGALVNIVLNIFLIPVYGINGAALSTFISYFIVFVLRALNTKKYIQINFNPLILFINLMLVSAQSFLIIYEWKNWIIYEAVLFAAMVLINAKPLFLSFKRITQ
jgi:O-antigen/teichoic acid export membrane protein